jgi:hypothetical protein
MAYELKTKVNDASVKAFLDKVDNDQRREDALQLLDIFGKVTKEEPKMWGSSIIGYGTYTYKYASGQTGDWMITGFSPRKASLSLYIMSGFDGIQDLLAKLGKHKIGKGCLYINKLEDVDIKVLEKLIKEGMKNPMGAI